MTLLAKQLDSEVPTFLAFLNRPKLGLTLYQGIHTALCSHRSLRQPHLRFEPTRRTQRKLQDADQRLFRRIGREIPGHQPLLPLQSHSGLHANLRFRAEIPEETPACI